MNFRSLFAWFYKRFFMGYGFLGGFMAVFNFIGIFTLILEKYVPLEPLLLMFLMAVGGIVGFVVVAVVIYDFLGMRTYFTEKEQSCDEYWHSKLNPLQQKQLLLTLEALEYNNFDELREKIKSGRL